MRDRKNVKILGQLEQQGWPTFSRVGSGGRHFSRLKMLSKVVSCFDDISSHDQPSFYVRLNSGQRMWIASYSVLLLLSCLTHQMTFDSLWSALNDPEPSKEHGQEQSRPELDNAVWTEIEYQVFIPSVSNATRIKRYSYQTESTQICLYCLQLHTILTWCHIYPGTTDSSSRCIMMTEDKKIRQRFYGSENVCSSGMKNCNCIAIEYFVLEEYWCPSSIPL